MYPTTVHEEGDSTSLTVPPELKERLQLREGDQFDLDFNASRFVLMPRRRSKYTIDELLAQCDYSLPMSQEDREWIDAPAVGRELI